MGKRTIVGKFVKNTWSNINIRCGKYKHLQTKEKCKNYDKVEIEFTREEFKNWCWEQQKLIESLTRPSIDRIDKNKNYTLNNIQIIELKYNIRKDKTKFTNKTGICYNCKNILSLNLFCKDKRRINGLSTLCKVCDSKRKTLKYGKNS